MREEMTREDAKDTRPTDVLVLHKEEAPDTTMADHLTVDQDHPHTTTADRQKDTIQSVRDTREVDLQGRILQGDNTVDLLDHHYHHLATLHSEDALHFTIDQRLPEGSPLQSGRALLAPTTLVADPHQKSDMAFQATGRTDFIQ